MKSFVISKVRNYWQLPFVHISQKSEQFLEPPPTLLIVTNTSKYLVSALWTGGLLYHQNVTHGASDLHFRSSRREKGSKLFSVVCSQP